MAAGFVLSRLSAVRSLMAIFVILFSGNLIASDQFSWEVFYLVDSEETLNIEQVVELGNDSWIDGSDETPNLGFIGVSVWFKVTLPRQLSLPSQFYALVDYANLDEVAYYDWDRQGQKLIEQVTIGDHYPFYDRPSQYPGFAFPISRNNDESRDLYFRIKTTGNAFFPFTLHSSESFAKKRQSFLAIYGLVAGAMIVTVFYNALVFIRTREKLFLGFSCFAGSMAFLFTAQSGLGFQYFWPNSLYWNELSVLHAVIATSAFHLIFSAQFLALKGLLKKLYLLGVGINILFFFSSFALPYSQMIRPLLAFSMFVSGASFLAAVGLMFVGHRSARIYLLAWSAFLIGMVVTVAIRFGLFPFNQVTEFSGIFGAMTTVIILSTAVADILNREKNVRISAQQSAIANLAKYEMLYESSLEGLFETTVNGKLVGANSAFITYMGYNSLDELKRYTNNQMANIYADKESRQALITSLLDQGQLFSQEMQMLRKDGSVFWASISMKLTSRLEGGDQKIEGTFIDISDRKQSEEQLKFLATHDPLTNLFNRRQFEQELKLALETTNDSARCSVIYMDLDQFKVVNDTCGHSAGDVLLKQLASLMQEKISDRGVLARLGGDEFGLLLKDCDVVCAESIGQEVMDLIQNYRFYFDEKTFALGISMGLVELSPATDSIEKVMSLADTACYAAKEAGRNRIHVYSASNVELQQRRNEMELVSAINSAIENDFFVQYQQLIVANDEKQSPLGYEVLLRMRDDQGELIGPNKFIPAAERYDLMPQVDRWVIEKCFKTLASDPHGLTSIQHCSINLSGNSLGDEGLKDFILKMFRQYAIPYNKVCFEITESAATQRIELTLKLVSSLKALGCLFSLDDFGSGFSSYGYLKNLPVDFLKIDGSFVRKIHQDPVDFAMVKSISDVARAMGMKTIAEYVENEEIVVKLKEIGVDYLQGFHIGKPAPMLRPQSTDLSESIFSQSPNQSSP